jgi:ribosomal-protein-alanine N-acetyltransferase
MSAVLRPEPWIRPLGERDLEAVVAIEREIYEFPWTLGNFRDSLQAGYSCWVLEYGPELVGYGVVMIGVQEAHLLNLSVRRGWQRRGLGRRLLEHFLEVAREAGARRMFLEVRPSNAAARALYAARGFREITVRRGYYPATVGREDAILMGLDL